MLFSVWLFFLRRSADLEAGGGDRESFSLLCGFFGLFFWVNCFPFVDYFAAASFFVVDCRFFFSSHEFSGVLNCGQYLSVVALPGEGGLGTSLCYVLVSEFGVHGV